MKIAMVSWLLKMFSIITVSTESKCGVSRVQQNYSGLAKVSSLEDKGPFLNIVDDKERAGVIVASKSERLEATRRICPEAI